MANPIHVLIVEDDGDIAELTAKFLRGNGLRVTLARDARAAHGAIAQCRPDIILLDLTLPGEDGLSLARRIRSGANTPIIMVTALGEETDRIVGLEMGADDYVAKPFSPRELLARIRAVLRRNGRQAEPEPIKAVTYVFAGWRLSTRSRELTDPAGVKVSLTGAEFELLCVFCGHPRRVLTRELLLDFAQGRSASPFDRSVDTLISRIRRKIEKDARDPEFLKTVRLGGYFFTPDVEAL